MVIDNNGISARIIVIGRMLRFKFLRSIYKSVYIFKECFNKFSIIENIYLIIL